MRCSLCKRNLPLAKFAWKNVGARRHSRCRIFVEVSGMVDAPSSNLGGLRALRVRVSPSTRMQSESPNVMLLEDGRVVCFKHAVECGLPSKRITNSEAYGLKLSGKTCVFCGDPYRCRGVTPPTTSFEEEEDA